MRESMVHRPPDRRAQFREQIRRLEQGIDQALKEYRPLIGEVERLQKELQSFLREYYLRFGALYRSMEQLESEIEIIRAGDAAAVPEERSPHAVSFAKQAFQPVVMQDMARYRYLDEMLESKKLFRKLAKRFHPDVTGDDPNAIEAFVLLKQTYENHDLQTLRLIEQALEGAPSVQESPVTTIDRLEQKLDAILRAKDRLLLKRHALLHSPEWRLCRKMAQSRLKGVDSWRRIERSIAEELEQKRRQLDYFKARAAFRAKVSG